MSSETMQQEVQSQAADVDAVSASPTSVAPPNERRRPRLNIAALGLGDGERKRGKSMFGVLVNTLNKAKAENKERNASEAAKKRQLIDQRLQSKLKKETDTVRQIEDAKKERISASRKEEEWQMKDSMHKLRRKRLPLLANFLLTSDAIRTSDEDMDSTDELSVSSLLPPRAHPAPLYYLPAKLLPEQEAFLKKRREKAAEVVEKEWGEFKELRSTAVEEISSIRKKVAESEQTADAQRREQSNDVDESKNGDSGTEDRKEADMDVDDEHKDESVKKTSGPGKEGGAPLPAENGDDAVEY